MKDKANIQDQISFILNGKPLVPSHQPLIKEQVNEHDETKRDIPSENISKDSQENK